MRRTDYPGTMMVLFATLVVVILGQFPFGETLIYPIRLFVTFVHEMSHVLATVLTGGTVHSFEVSPDTSGAVTSSGGVGFIISSAGYVGTAILGTLCVHFLRTGSYGRIVLSTFTVLMLCSVLLAFGNLFTLAWSLIILGGFVLVLLKFPRSAADYVATFVSVQLMFNAFHDMKTLVFLSTTNTHTDAMNMQAATGVPAIVWALAWMSMALYFAWRTFIR